MSLKQPDNQESMLTAVLERKPAIAIPADFHLRLRASIAAEPASRANTHVSFARATAYFAAFCLAFVLVALTVIYPNAIKAPESMTFVLELMLLAQLMAVGFWLGMRRES
jgi:hypothetical protein